MKPPSSATILKWLFASLELVLVIWAATALSEFFGLWIRNPIKGSGSYWFGGIGLKLEPSLLHLSAPSLSGSNVTLDNVFGSIGVDLTSAGAAIKTLLGPLCGIVVFRTGMMIAMCDLFRRLFRSVERRDVFSGRNVRRIQKYGYLIIAMAVATALCERSYGYRVDEFILKNVTVQGGGRLEMRLPPTMGMSAGTYMVGHTVIRVDEDGVMIGSLIRLDLRWIFLGLGLISLGAALRQGLALREENELTV